MSRKHIVFLDMNKTSAGVTYLHAAKRLGMEVTFATFDPQYYLQPGETIETSVLRHADHILTVDTHHDLDRLVETLREYGKQRPIDGVLASLDLEMVQAAIVADRLGLPGTWPSAVELTRNKYAMRQKLQELGIPSPRFRLVDSVEEAQQAASEFGYPCILKPVDTTGSEMVQLITKPEEFSEPMRFHKENPLYWRGIKKFPQLLVEEYMTGPLLSVETIGDGKQTHVLGVTDRLLSEPPYFAEIFASFPAEPPGSAAAIEMTVQTLKAIGYEFGVAHTELIITPAGPRIVEINPRFVGGTCSSIISWSLGYSVHEEVLKMYVGLPASFDVSYKGYGLWQQFIAPKPGKIRSISGVEAAAATPGVREIAVDKQVGDQVTHVLTRNMDAIGHFTVFAENRAQALQIAADVLAKLVIEIEEVEAVAQVPHA